MSAGGMNGVTILDPYSLDPTRYWLLGQIEYYFSFENLCRDMFLRSKVCSPAFSFLSISPSARHSDGKQGTDEIDSMIDGRPRLAPDPPHLLLQQNQESLNGSINHQRNHVAHSIIGDEWTIRQTERKLVRLVIAWCDQIDRRRYAFIDSGGTRYDGDGGKEWSRCDVERVDDS